MQASQTLLRNNRGSLAALGYGVAGVALLAIVALLHHPVGYGRQSLEILASIQSQARVDQLVHAVLAAVFRFLAIAIVSFAMRLGLWRVTVITGLVHFEGR